jgi:hypothetical protein
MSDRYQNPILGGPAVGIGTCFGWLLACPHRADCLRAITRLDVWAAAGTRVALPLLAALCRLGGAPDLANRPHALEGGQVAAGAGHAARAVGGRGQDRRGG